MESSKHFQSFHDLKNSNFIPSMSKNFYRNLSQDFISYPRMCSQHSCSLLLQTLFIPGEKFGASDSLFVIAFIYNSYSIFTVTTLASFFIVGLKDPGYVKTNHFKVETESVRFLHSLKLISECDKLYIRSCEEKQKKN